MTLYADSPLRRARQIITDLLVAAWVVLWIKVAVHLYDLVRRLATPGRAIEDAGTSMSGSLNGAGDRAASIPGVGGPIASGLRKAADGAHGLTSAGQVQQDVVHDLAWYLAIGLIAVPMAMVLFGWLPLRVRWVMRASTARRLRDDPAGLDLLALRALTRQPLRRLRSLDPDIAAAWRRGDEEPIAQLAALELSALGLRRLADQGLSAKPTVE